MVRKAFSIPFSRWCPGSDIRIPVAAGTNECQNQRNTSKYMILVRLGPVTPKGVAKIWPDRRQPAKCGSGGAATFTKY